MKNVKEVTIRLEKEEWTKALDKAFNNKKKDLKVDGFRKGSCPKDIYIKKFGIEKINVGIEFDVTTTCETCGGEIKVPITFPDGYKSLFVPTISDLGDELL